MDIIIIVILELLPYFLFEEIKKGNARLFLNSFCNLTDILKLKELGIKKVFIIDLINLCYLTSNINLSINVTNDLYCSLTAPPFSDYTDRTQRKGMNTR